MFCIRAQVTLAFSLHVHKAQAPGASPFHLGLPNVLYACLRNALMLFPTTRTMFPLFTGSLFKFQLFEEITGQAGLLLHFHFPSILMRQKNGQ